jgi:hypothetical protein
MKLFSANEIIGIKTPLVPTLLRCSPDFSNNMGEGRNEISLFGPVNLKNMTTAKDIKKDLSFLTGLSSSTWLRYPKIRGLTKHHKAKITILYELIKMKFKEFRQFDFLSSENRYIRCHAEAKFHLQGNLGIRGIIYQFPILSANWI